MGDPAGIGLDVTLEAWTSRTRLGLHPFVVYGEREALRQRALLLALDVPFVSVADPREAVAAFAQALPVLSPGSGSRGGADPVVSAIESATEAVARGEALALLTNPIAKASLGVVPLEYPGHTAYLGLLAERFVGGGPYRPVMMLVADELKVVPATVHIALADVPRTLTRALLDHTIHTTAGALRQDFGIERPRIAVAGLNPHAGEQGLIGSEEASLIAPAIADAVRQGLDVSGPHSADALFYEEARRGYDAAIAMYHDQALIPLKTLAFDRGVNVTLGLPFVRTSPDHGTAYALAGTGKARASSFIAALQLAAKLGARRRGMHAASRP